MPFSILKFLPHPMPRSMGYYRVLPELRAISITLYQLYLASMLMRICRRVIAYRRGERMPQRSQPLPPESLRVGLIPILEIPYYIFFLCVCAEYAVRKRI